MNGDLLFAQFCGGRSPYNHQFLGLCIALDRHRFSLWYCWQILFKDLSFFYHIRIKMLLFSLRAVGLLSFDEI